MPRYESAAGMTLCIAAGCVDFAIPTEADVERPRRMAWEAAVVSADRLVTGSGQQSDTGHKFVELTPLWCALCAGELPWAREFARSCSAAFRDQDVLDEDTLPERILAAAKLYAVRREVAQRFGVRYDDALNDTAKVSPGVAERIFACIDDVQLPQQQILFVGWLKHRFVFVMYSYGNVWIEDEYAAVGSGAEHALMMLNLRGFDSFNSIDVAVYATYEAQRFGARAPGVGKHTWSSLLQYDRVKNRVVSRSVHGPPGGFLDRTYHERRFLFPPLPNEKNKLSDNFRLDSDVLDGPWDQTPFFGRRGEDYDEHGQEKPVHDGRAEGEGADAADDSV